jgi:hypothetical protein
MAFFKDLRKIVKQIESISSSDSKSRQRTPEKFFELNENTYHQVLAVIEARSAVEKNVLARSDEYQEIEVVGESFYTEDIRTLVSKVKDYENVWFSGLLVPEPDNKYDRFAIAVYIIDTTSKPLRCVKVGHIAKDEARQIQPRLMKLLAEKKKIVPLLTRIKGGSGQKENFGVFARAYTSLARTK